MSKKKAPTIGDMVGLPAIKEMARDVAADARSLIAVTHTFSTDVYTDFPGNTLSDGFFSDSARCINGHTPTAEQIRQTLATLTKGHPFAASRTAHFTPNPIALMCEKAPRARQ